MVVGYGIGRIGAVCECYAVVGVREGGREGTPL